MGQNRQWKHREAWVRIFRLALAILFVACSGRCVALSGAPAMKRLLISGNE